MIKKIFGYSFYFIVINILLNGCYAYFPGNALPNREGVQLELVKNIKFSVEHRALDGSILVSRGMDEVISKRKNFVSSWGSQTGDYHLIIKDLVFPSKRNPSEVTSICISTCSLGIIPGYSEVYFKKQFIVYKNGEIIKTYQYEDYISERWGCLGITVPGGERESPFGCRGEAPRTHVKMLNNIINNFLYDFEKHLSNQGAKKDNKAMKADGINTGDNSE